jgi:nickel-dependent lactate racemase
MEIRLEYGRDGLLFCPPAGLRFELLDLPEKPSLEFEPILREALSSPFGTPALGELARGKTDACIVVCDITRPVPNSAILPVIGEMLESAGIPRERITVLIATGTHRPNTVEEQVAMFGKEVVARYRVVNHAATDDHPYLGVSPNGVPIRLNACYLDADLKITVGMIEPHFMAGFAGGRKMVMPGVAALETVRAWHSPRFLEHPKATNGEVDENPVHLEALAICRLAPPDFIIDVALDHQKRPYAAFCGHFERAWEAGVQVVRDYVTATVAEPVDVVLTTCGGYPLDLTYYQTVKGMVGALPILKPGGTIIVAGECAEGVGNRHFRDTLYALPEIRDFAERIQRADWTFVPDQWQVEELARAARHAGTIRLVSSLASEVAERLFVIPHESVESALESTLQAMGGVAKVAIIPKGPYVLPSVR